MKRPWQIPMAALRQGDNVFEFEGSARELGLEPHEVAENPSFETLVGNIRARVVITRSGSRSLVRGRVMFRTRLECAVCWQEFEQEFDEELTAELVSSQEQPLASELDGFELDQSPLAGDLLDLLPLLRDSIHLAIPIAPRCRPDCRGVCPECGANLNAGDCGCGAAAVRRGR
uniref:DUF177 domain-containing protein n=1 Tax=candidate division WOR-3 bacterium TaxID=2052148 RepID=A0A7C4GI79_UNCW3